jgi:hypothetical protein
VNTHFLGSRCWINDLYRKAKQLLIFALIKFLCFSDFKGTTNARRKIQKINNKHGKIIKFEKNSRNFASFCKNSAKTD